MIECRKCKKPINTNIPDLKEWTCAECAFEVKESELVDRSLLQ